MDEHKLEYIYQKIAQTVVDTIPEEWIKVYTYAEISDDVSNVFFYYYSNSGISPIHSHNIPKLFDFDERDYEVLWEQILGNFEELWSEFKKQNQESWTNLTMFFNSEGDIKVEYDYEDLSDADDYERRIIWKYKYLNLKPEDEDDKEFLEKYLKSIEVNNE
jgi:uncharacterized protein (TIGR01741 family)